MLKETGLKKRGFGNVPKSKLREYASATNSKQRSPELKNAWNHQADIKSARADGMSVKELADLFNVSIYNIYRILR